MADVLSKYPEVVENLKKKGYSVDQIRRHLEFQERRIANYKQAYYQRKNFHRDDER